MKIEIGKTDKGWRVTGEGLMGEMSVNHVSDHETACDAAREAASVLSVWATTVGRCKPLKQLWLVLGRSEKDNDFAYVVSADSRLGAVAALAKRMGLKWGSSRNSHDELRVIINMREGLPEDGWECPRYFWEIGCCPINFGLNLSRPKVWEWDEELEGSVGCVEKADCDEGVHGES